MCHLRLPVWEMGIIGQPLKRGNVKKSKLGQSNSVLHVHNTKQEIVKATLHVISKSCENTSTSNDIFDLKILQHETIT